MGERPGAFAVRAILEQATVTYLAGRCSRMLAQERRCPECAAEKGKEANVRNALRKARPDAAGKRELHSASCHVMSAWHEHITRQPSKDSSGNRRPAAESMMNHVKAVREALPTLKPGLIVTKKNAQVNLLVVRNPKEWSHGDVDGGAGGRRVSSMDVATETCTVYWYESGQVHDCNIGRKGVLCKPCGNIPGSLGGDDGLASVGMAKSAIEAVRTLLGGRGKKGNQAATPVEPFARQISPFARKSSPFDRQISYAQYAERTQTVVIFDWDDTLFPTTYVKHDLGLNIGKHLRDQALRPQMMMRARTSLAKAAGAADRLLRLADERGKVVVVTLARSPWVTDSCKFFYPGIGELIEKLNIQILYARENEQIDYATVNAMAKDQFETFWAETKGKAISKALGEFYSQYDGQSWKNVISLGDSHFERYGTMAATMQYAAAQGLVGEEEVSPASPSVAARPRRGSGDSTGSRLSVSSVKRHEGSGQGRRMSWQGRTVGGQAIKVRTKTFKMLEEPTEEELIVELSLLHRWLPLMVELDDGFDVDLNSLDGEAQIDEIESTLRALKCEAEMHAGSMFDELADGYAKYRAMQIRDSVRQGVSPAPPPAGGSAAAPAAASGGGAAPTEAAAAPAPPPTAAAPAAGVPRPAAQPPAGPRLPGSGDGLAGARKQAEYAASALDFGDVTTARQCLHEALRLLDSGAS
ncbi:unnamed protein product [Prorocentrum cordatum]|uniref:Vta1 C-terminal domain-containing protein n=1 Tax=Prorocentrum cordatum TaxID=2364126 RepID=A0ABN9UVB0_9DINO|nr:unnamed protein product [Polarella glacialis]